MEQFLQFLSAWRLAGVASATLTCSCFSLRLKYALDCFVKYGVKQMYCIHSRPAQLRYEIRYVFDINVHYCNKLRPKV